MNFGIVLIILSALQTVLCSHSNSSGNDTCGLCTISWFRRKRAQTEYTRWRANQETTQEFIVKVLDDDLTTFATQKIVAVNIQPLSKNEKKIIIGGALVPPTTSLITLTEPADYTRFIPPTTIPLEPLEIAKVRSILEDLVVTPKGLTKSDNQISHNKNQPMKHIHRDESPPSGPQFLGRSQSSLAQQFAPVVARVSFYHGTTVAPLTPRSVDRFMYKTRNPPTRTFRLPDVIKPSRTTSKTSFHNIFLFDNNYITDDHMLQSHINVPAIDNSQTSWTSFTTLSTRQYQDDSFGHPTEDKLKLRRNQDNTKNEKDSDLSYNAVISNYEEHSGKNSRDDEDELPVTDLEIFKVLNESVEDTNEFDNSTESDSDAYFEEGKYPENVTSRHSSTNTLILNRLTATETTKKMQMKPKQNCSMIKLRQLNFNSPRTLPEIVAQLKQWAETSPLAKWLDITNGNYTTMENPIYLMIVDDPSSGQIISAKKTVMVIAADKQASGPTDKYLSPPVDVQLTRKCIFDALPWYRSQQCPKDEPGDISCSVACTPYGIQGRDHHAVAAAMYVLYQLIERSEAHADLLTKYRFWVIPIFNPDGYDYSMTFPHKREWTKNLRQKWDTCKGRESCEACELYGLRCTIQTCYGVNLDRNFEYQWIPTEELRAEHPCGALYAGERQLSEVETRALTHFLHERRTPLFTFVAFKEGDVLVSFVLFVPGETFKAAHTWGVLYPYSHTRKRRAFDNVYRQRASQAASAAYSIGGRPYVAGQTSEFLPLYAGGVEDWIDGHLGIDNTYTVMMFRPSDSYNSKLITERVVHEAYAAMDTLLLQSADKFGPPLVTLTAATAPLSASFSTQLMVVTLIFYCITY